MRDGLMELFTEWLTDMINDEVHDWSFIDGFCVDNELTDKEIAAIQSVRYKVAIEKASA